MPAFKLYFHFVKVRIKSQMEYRFSFLMELFTNLWINLVDLLVIALLFARFHNLQQWGLWEVVFLYGIVNISFALAQVISRGFEDFPALVVGGQFDNMLLRPLGTFYQVFTSQFQLRRIGRLIQALVVFCIASIQLEVNWTLGSVLFLGATLVGGVCVFIGLNVIGATTCFWTVQSVEIINIFTYGGKEASSYPISIYRYWFRNFFTFVVPIAFVNYFPSLVLLEKVDSNGAPIFLSYIAPTIGPFFLMLAFVFWNFGVRHYQSTGH